MSSRRPQEVVSMGCLKVAQGLPTASIFNGNKSVAISRVVASGDGAIPIRGPFHGLTICVTGLSKDARKQVQEATVRMGGCYSSDLHLQCTHLVVQSFSGRKFEHALTHGLRRGLFVVTLAWLVNCVKLNVRLNESLYSVKHMVNSGVPLEEFSQVTSVVNGVHSCMPVGSAEDKSLSVAVCTTSQPSSKCLVNQETAVLSTMCFYVDPELPTKLRAEVVEAAAKEGATFVARWFIGCEASHVICEGDAMLKYLGFNSNLVTPLWVMKTIRERHLQRLVQLSPDLARHISILLDTTQLDHMIEDYSKSQGRELLAVCGPGHEKDVEAQIQERQEKINAAKAGIRKRCAQLMQPRRNIPCSVTPMTLLESVCWSIAEPPSAAHFYADNNSSSVLETDLQPDIAEDISHEDGRKQWMCGIPEYETYASPMTESERKEVVFKGSFLTILFPIDRFGELGPSSRTFFSEKGFRRQHILDHIYNFYQDYLSSDEVNVAIHTDSKHADKLRSVYVNKETIELGCVPIKRVDFLGSRKNFEGLRRVGRENTGRVYELWLVA